MAHLYTLCTLMSYRGCSYGYPCDVSIATDHESPSLEPFMTLMETLQRIWYYDCVSIAKRPTTKQCSYIVLWFVWWYGTCRHIQVISSCVRSFRYDLCAITVLGEAKTESNLFQFKLHKFTNSKYYVQYISNQYEVPVLCCLLPLCCTEWVSRSCGHILKPTR